MKGRWQGESEKTKVRKASQNGEGEVSPPLLPHQSGDGLYWIRMWDCDGILTTTIIILVPYPIRNQDCDGHGHASGGRYMIPTGIWIYQVRDDPPYPVRKGGDSATCSTFAFAFHLCELGLRCKIFAFPLRTSVSRPAERLLMESILQNQNVEPESSHGPTEAPEAPEAVESDFYFHFLVF